MKRVLFYFFNCFWEEPDFNTLALRARDRLMEKSRDCPLHFTLELEGPRLQCKPWLVKNPFAINRIALFSNKNLINAFLNHSLNQLL